MVDAGSLVSHARKNHKQKHATVGMSRMQMECAGDGGAGRRRRCRAGFAAPVTSSSSSLELVANARASKANLQFIIAILATVAVFCRGTATAIALPAQTSHARNTSSQIQQNIIMSTGQRARPIIGVLTEVLRDYKRFTDTRHLHIAASYVKWIEAAGAQVMPVLLEEDESYYKRVFEVTNGILFPGGDNMLDPSRRTPMMVAAQHLYKLAVDANDRGDYYPIWGTCLGMELLTVLTSGRNELDDCLANDMLLPMRFTQDQSRLFAPDAVASTYPLAPIDAKSAADNMIRMFSEKPLTYNFHHKCMTDAGMKRANLNEFYSTLSYSNDIHGLEFLAMIEARKYPFWGVQFHPEKAPFEFVVKKTQQNIGHSPEDIAASQYFASFFVREATRNKHTQRPQDSELIYAHAPTYTALKRDMYEQRYLFPFRNMDPTLDTCEFIEDHVPADDEEPSEEVCKRHVEKRSVHDMLD